MKLGSFAFALLVGFVALPVDATEDGLVMVPQPLDTIQEGIKVVEVPFMIGKSLPESAFQAIGQRYAPPSISFNEHEDINVASIAGIKIEPEYMVEKLYQIELNYQGVKEEHQTEELLGAILKCIYHVAENDNDGWDLDVKITNLKADSPLHKALKKLVAELEED